MPKHFMRIRDLGHSGAWEIIRRAKEMKETNYRGHCMDGKVASPSTSPSASSAARPSS